MRSDALVAPLLVGPNRPHHFYAGGAQIDAFRRSRRSEDPNLPEDWVASTTPLGWPGRDAHEGQSVVEIGDEQLLLSDLVERYPEIMLGTAHLRAFGPTTALLVKLLDPAVRLPIHAHPSRAFAQAHLNSFFGKAEAWIVLGVDASLNDPYVHLGFSEDIDETRLRAIVERQDVAELLRVTHRLSVAPGDVVFVPAGLPHAIGPGLFIVELQEPTNYSILIEHVGLPVTIDQAHLGLGWDLALRAVDRRGHSCDELDHFTRRGQSIAARDAALLPEVAEPYFRARRLGLAPGDLVATQRSFTIGVVLSGGGVVSTSGGTLSISAGQTFCVAAAAGEPRFRAGTSGLRVITCLPPDPTRVG